MDKIISIKQSNELDKNSKLSVLELIDNASKGIFEIIKKEYKKSKVIVVCGPGNNGADGYGVAKYLLEDGWDVAVLINDIPTYDNAEIMYNKWNDKGGKSINFKYVDKDTFNNCELVIDAIFGSGLNKKITGEYKRIIELINFLKIPIISIDIPSGINADTGAIYGVAVKATKTISFILPKIAHVILPSKEYCGDVKIIDIGITEEEILQLNIRTFINNTDLWKNNLPEIKMSDNKYTRGTVLINSGEMYGATILASKAARKVGAGLVNIVCDDDNYNTIAFHTISDILKKANTIKDFENILQDNQIDSILIGSGNGKNKILKDKIFAILKYTKCPVIFDADAISVFENNKDEIEKLFKSINRTCIFTPHIVEFKRMFDYNENDKINSVKKAAEKSKSIIVLKGYDTIIASPSGEVVINNHASPYLSIAGSGDVLAGMIASLVAQGMNEFKATCCSVWLHGEVSIQLNKIFLIEELIDNLNIKDIN